MQLTKGAIGNLINRYKAVLKKCHLLNVFGSLAVAGMLVMGGAAAAGAVTVTTGQDFKDAVTDAEAGATITLGQDIEQGLGAVFDNKDVTVDFAGHRYTAYAGSVGSTGTESQLFQLLKGSTVTLKNGTLDVASPTDESGKFKMVLQNYCNLTLENMVVDGSNLQDSVSYTMSNNHGNVVIKDSTIIAKEGGFAFDVYYWSKYYEDGVSVTVTDSIIDGRIEVTVDGNKAIGDNTHSLSISGGTLVGGLTATDGGQLYTVGTTFLSNVDINNNTATNRGGGIYNAVQNASDGGIAGRGQLTLDSVSFSGNKAAQGGAIYNAGTLTADAVSFSNNSATGKGGAIYNTGTMTVGGTFTDNTASQGGAISNYKAAESTVSDGSIFKDNTATSVGGAISHVDSEKLTIGNNVLFEGNQSIAGQGGALHNQRASTEIGDNVKFHNNIAKGYGGGAIYQDTDSTASSVTIGTDAEFIGNQTETSHGGAIMNFNGGDGATVTIGAGAKFDSNKAGKTGGAISNWGGIVSVADASFTNNSAATNGGAIYNDTYFQEDSSFTIDGATFTGNKAEGISSQGGAIYNAGKLTVNNGEFIGNSATRYGGAIADSYQNASQTDINNSIFKENTAQSGGAIALWSPAEAKENSIIGTIFEGNNAEKKGGAIAVLAEKDNVAASLTINGDTFTGNTAGESGGALHLEYASVTISDATFSGNSAVQQGGAIYNDADSSITFKGINSFSDNTAAEGNDIYNAGSIIVADGTTTLGSGLTQVGGEIFVNGGTLDMASGSSLSFMKTAR